MRFLLHAKRQGVGRAAAKKNAGKIRAPNHATSSTTPKLAMSQNSSVSISSPTTTISTKESPSYRMWGQQCSPQCGCAVRFETVLDDQHRVLSAKYTAKTVVTHPTLFAFSSNNVDNTNTDPRNKHTKLLLTECTCQTLHHLARQVTLHLPHKPLHRLRNGLEFEQHRSSLAFQHAALRAQGLPTHHVHCYDVVEEALGAMIKGHAIVPRNMKAGRPREGSATTPRTYQEALQRYYNSLDTKHLQQIHEEDVLLVEDYEQQQPEHRGSSSIHHYGRQSSSSSSAAMGVDRNVSMTSRAPWNFWHSLVEEDSFRSSASSSNRDGDAMNIMSSSTGRRLSLLDLYDDETYHLDAASGAEADSPSQQQQEQQHTWESYVDELYRQFEQEHEQRSA